MTTPHIVSLAEPAEFASLILNNRIVMAPMTRSRALGKIPNELMAIYYAQRASAGLIVTEGTAPSLNGLGYSRTPAIYNSEQVAGWEKVTDAVHEKNGKIFIQLMHVGRIAHPNNTPAGARIIAPSAIAAQGEMWTDQQGLQPFPTPEAMTNADITQTIEEFAQAAQYAIEAGFDGIELHGANGYLFEQFLNPHVNVRTDAYGGSVENRSRFLLDVTQAVINRIGKDKVGVRLSPYNVYNDIPPYKETADTYDYLSKELHQLGIVYLHLVDHSARKTEEGLRLIETIRQNFQGILILNGGYTAQRAEEVLLSRTADLVSFGAPFIANPDLPYRLAHNLPLAAPDAGTFFTANEVGYTDYSFHQ